MKIKLLFFAQVREKMGTGERIVEFEEGTSVSDAARILGLGDLPLFFAVNESIVEPECTLIDKDVAAFLTPVAGGAV